MTKNRTKESNGKVGVYEFARLTGLSLQHIYTQLWLGKLPAKKQGRRWLIERKLVAEYRKSSAA